ncbi:MAG: hypothetical protein VW438_00090 [Euryarchaeota archaeon]
MSEQERGFGPGFEKDVAAILATADRGLLYAREVRENLAKAGMLIYDSVEMPEIELPQSEDVEMSDPMQLIGHDDTNDDTEEDVDE